MLDALTTSSTATYNLTKDSVAYTPVSAQSLLVSLNGVTQAPIAAYTISGSTIVFASALTSNDVIDYIIAFEGPIKNVGASDISAGTLTTSMLAEGAITVAKMAANSVDSDQYVDGSIDLAHMSANSVDSDQYVDGSIDLIHMSANSVDSDQYVDGSIDLVHMSSESVDEDNLLISNGGTNGQYLQKQSGNTGGLTWADVSAGLTLETVKTSNFTAVAGKQYSINTTSQAITMTLPTASPNAGDTIGIIDYSGTFDTNNLTIAQANSKKIFRADENGTIDTKNWSTSIKFIDDTVGWLVVGD